MEKVILDTSVWIDFFRGQEKSLVDEVGRLIQNNQVVLIGIVLMELLQGALDKKEFERIKKLLEPLERVDPTNQDWEEAGSISFELRKKGMTTSTVDALIATLAIRNDCLLFTRDNHFTQIEKHSDLRLYK